MFALIVSAAAASAYPSTAATTVAGRLPPPQRTLPAINPGTWRDIGAIRSEVDAGRDRGDLSRKQARQLRREAREIGMLERRYASGGLTEPEREELRARVEMLRALTRAKRSGILR